MQTKEQATERINFLLRANHNAPFGHLESITDRELLDCNVEEMWADYVFDIPKTAENYTGTAHGGYLGAIADAGMTIAARGLLGNTGLVTTTLDLNLNAIKPMYVGDHIRMRCRLLHAGKRVILANADFYRGDEHCATAISNMMLLPESHVRFTSWALEGNNEELDK